VTDFKASRGVEVHFPGGDLKIVLA
jgi:hypothetical protein